MINYEDIEIVEFLSKEAENPNEFKISPIFINEKETKVYFASFIFLIKPINVLGICMQRLIIDIPNKWIIIDSSSYKIKYINSAFLYSYDLEYIEAVKKAINRAEKKHPNGVFLPELHEMLRKYLPNTFSLNKTKGDFALEFKKRTPQLKNYRII